MYYQQPITPHTGRLGAHSWYNKGGVGGTHGQKHWVSVSAVRFLKPLRRYFRPKSVVFPTLFQT